MVPHPMIVDFAVALLVTSFVCDLLALGVDEPEFAIVAWWTLVFGTLAAVFSVISGLTSAAELEVAGEAADKLSWHRSTGFATLACFGLCTIWRGARQGQLPERMRGLYLLVAGLGTALLTVTGWFGGTLVFRLGVGVGTPS